MYVLRQMQMSPHRLANNAQMHIKWTMSKEKATKTEIIVIAKLLNYNFKTRYF